MYKDASGISIGIVSRLTRFIEAHLEVTSKVRYLVLHMRIHMAWLARH